MTDELIGRMWLWSSALFDSAECLMLAERLGVTANSDIVKTEVEAQHRHYEIQTGRKFSPHRSYSDDMAVLASFERVLPLTNECLSAAHHLRKLAIVYFMQMYATGGSSPLSVADNQKSRVKDLRQQVEAMAYPNLAERENFRDLVSIVRKARNKQIGHADGAEAAVRHQPNSVVHNVYVVSPLIWIELHAAIRKLQLSIQKILSNLLLYRSSPQAAISGAG